MRVYNEMECDCSCEDGYFCEYFDTENKRCNFKQIYEQANNESILKKLLNKLKKNRKIRRTVHNGQRN